MKTIITVQHTQSVHHTNGMVGSWTDWELTEKGKEQAERIGERLSAELAGKKCVLYSSDLRRTQQTAEAVGRRFTNGDKRRRKALYKKNERYVLYPLRVEDQKENRPKKFSVGFWLICT